MKLKILILSVFSLFYSGVSMATSALFPITYNFDKEYLQQNFWRCSYSSAGESQAYKLVIPNYMKPISIKPEPIAGANMTEIGTYQTIKDLDILTVGMRGDESVISCNVVYRKGTVYFYVRVSINAKAYATNMQLVHLIAANFTPAE